MSKSASQVALSKNQVDRLVEMINRGVESKGIEGMAAFAKMSPDDVCKARDYRLRIDIDLVESFCRNTGVSISYILDGKFPVYLST